MEPGKWQSIDADGYDQKWAEMAASGENPHGEVDFVQRFSPKAVLDAGCGTGRVAIELANREVDVMGVDLDEPFITQARAKAPHIQFELDDLATVSLDKEFDSVVMAGNVMIFVAPGTEAQVVANMARHVKPGGQLIAGFQLGRGLSADEYNAHATAAGLYLAEHWCSWSADEPTEDAEYAVLVHTSAS